MSNFYIKSLDGLRGIAVLLVIVYHFSKLPFITFDFELGWVGVQLFFVLSGYLISRILIQEKEKTLSTYMGRFYWRRALRIFPIYFLYLLLITIIHIFTGEPTDYNFASPLLFTYTYNFSVLFEGWEITRLYSHLWSLSVEEQFYLFWPLLVFFISTKNLFRVCIGLIVLIPIFRFALEIVLSSNMSSPELIGTGIYWFTVSHLDAFACGCILNLLSTRTSEVILKYRWVIWLIVATCGIFNLLNYSKSITGYEISSLGYLLPSLENYQAVWSYSLLNLLFATIILKNIIKGSSILETRAMVFIGRISYGMYLYHFIIIVLIEKVFKQAFINDGVTLLICIILVVITSYLSFLLIEKKFLDLKNRKFISHHTE